MKYAHKLPDDLPNIPKGNILVDFFKLLFALGFSFVILFLIITWSIDKIVDSITPEQEKYLMSNFKLSLFKDAKESQYLQDVLDKISPCIPLPYSPKVYIIEMNEPNALAALGGNIYVTSELMKELGSENELAFILGHELGHFKHKDHLRQMGYGVFFIAARLFLGEAGNFGFSDTLFSLGGARYSQEAELRADMEGIKGAVCAYGNATDTLRFFKNQNTHSQWEYFGSTHPDFEKRIKAIESYIKLNDIDTKTPAIALGEL